MEKRNLWILLGKQLSGEITRSERSSLEKLIREGGKDISYLIEFLEEEWKKESLHQATDGAKAEEQWNRLTTRLGEISEDGNEPGGTSYHPRGRLLKPWYKMAACLVVLLCAAFYIRTRFVTRTSTDMHVVVVENGTRKQVDLPDGTHVWLNSGSRLWYQGTLGADNRTVWLEGEAFFKVVSDASTPFTVRARNITVRVLGTNFNVKAYKDDPDIETTLISGKVQVLLNNDPEKKVLLSPHEKLTVMFDSHVTSRVKATEDRPMVKDLPVIPKANALKYQVQTLPLNTADSTYFTETAWVRNELAFSYQPFSTVAKEMERRYNVHIYFRSDSLKTVLMSGVFDKETIVEALNVLKLITRFNYRIEKDSIYLNN